MFLKRFFFISVFFFISFASSASEKEKILLQLNNLSSLEFTFEQFINEIWYQEFFMSNAAEPRVIHYKTLDIHMGNY